MLVGDTSRYANQSSTIAWRLSCLIPKAVKKASSAQVDVYSCDEALRPGGIHESITREHPPARRGG